MVWRLWVGGLYSKENILSSDPRSLDSIKVPVVNLPRLRQFVFVGLFDAIIIAYKSLDSRLEE